MQVITLASNFFRIKIIKHVINQHQTINPATTHPTHPTHKPQSPYCTNPTCHTTVAIHFFSMPFNKGGRPKGTTGSHNQSKDAKLRIEPESVNATVFFSLTMGDIMHQQGVHGTMQGGMGAYNDAATCTTRIGPTCSEYNGLYQADIQTIAICDRMVESIEDEDLPVNGEEAVSVVMAETVTEESMDLH